jgi:hypothetical protein
VVDELWAGEEVLVGRWSTNSWLMRWCWWEVVDELWAGEEVLVGGGRRSLGWRGGAP